MAQGHDLTRDKNDLPTNKQGHPRPWWQRWLTESVRDERVKLKEIFHPKVITSLTKKIGHCLLLTGVEEVIRLKRNVPLSGRNPPSSQPRQPLGNPPLPPPPTEEGRYIPAICPRNNSQYTEVFGIPRTLAGRGGEEECSGGNAANLPTTTQHNKWV